MNSKDVAIVASGVILSVGVVYLGIRIYDDYFAMDHINEPITTTQSRKKRKKHETYEIVINLDDIRKSMDIQGEEKSCVEVRRPKKKLTDRIVDSVSDKLSKIPITATIDMGYSQK